MADFKKLKVWRKAHALALNSRRVSSELEYHLIVAKDTHVIPKSDFLMLLNDVIEVRTMLYGLLGRLPNKASKARE